MIFSKFGYKKSRPPAALTNCSAILFCDQNSIGYILIMIFLGRILSWAMVVLGTFRAGLGIYVSARFQGDAYTTAAMQFFPFSTPGKAIDQGVLILVAGVVLGLLAVIAKNTQSN